MCFIVALNSEIVFFWKTEIALLHHYTLWLYSANIPQLFLRITLICTIVLIQNLLTRGGNKFQSYFLCCIKASRGGSAFNACVNN